MVNMIISFSSLGNYGRLGNQLFQIAGTLGMAEKYGAQASFPEWKYEQYFENVLPHGEMPTTRVEEKHFHHYDWGLTGDCDLRGYMQSEKNFGSERLKFKQEFIDLVRLDNDIFHRPVICIQVRRGD